MDGNLKRELKQYEKRKARAQDKGDLEEEAKLCSAAGDLLKQHGFYEESIKEHNHALQIYEAKNNVVESAVAHRMIGECLSSLGQHKQSLYHQKLYLKLAKSSNNLVEEQRAWATIGSAWFSYSDCTFDAELKEQCLIEAQKGFLEGLSVCDQLTGLVPEKEIIEMRSRLYLNLGLVYDSKYDMPSARKFINQALNTIRGQNLLDTECKCYYNLGGLLTRAGLDTEAINEFNHALHVTRKNGQKFEEAEVLVGLGQVYLKMEEFTSARKVLKKAYKIAESRADEMNGLKPSLVAAIKGLKLINKLNQLSEGKESEQVNVLDQLGDLYSDLKFYKNALEYYNKELDLARSIGQSAKKLSNILVSVAVTYSDLGQLSKAVDYYMEELNTIDGDYTGMCDTWCNIAEIYEKANYNYEDVEQAYFSALKLAEKANSIRLQIRVKRCLADAQKKYNKMDLYEETVKKIDTLKSELGDDEEESEEEADKSEDCVKFEDDNVLIDREMKIPESDDEENDSDTDESAVRNRKRTARSKLSKVNEKGETPLHRAAIAGDAHLVGALLDQGADVNARDYCGWQPLHEACNHGHTETVRVLLTKGANVNDPGGVHCQGVTPLHDASQNGHIDIVKLLVEHGASLLNKDKNGKTPLDSVIAVQRSEDSDLTGSETAEAAGRKKVVKYLKKFALGKNLNNNITCPEITRRNRLFFEDSDIFDKDDDDNDDDNDEDDDVIMPSFTQFKEKLQSRDKKRAKNRQRASIDSDDDSDDVSAPFVPSPLVDSSPIEDSIEILNSLNDNPIEKRAAIQEQHAHIDDFESSSPIGFDSDDSMIHHNRASTSHDALRVFSRDNNRNMDDSIHQSCVPSSSSSVSYIDTVHGSHVGSRESESVPSLISERDLEYAMGATVNDDSDWLIDDMRPLKRRRTNPKQATLGKSLQLSSKRPIAYQRKTPRTQGSTATRTHNTPSSRNHSTNSNRTSKPRQTRLEVVRTPSPTFGSMSEIPSYNDPGLNAPRQSRTSGTSFQGEPSGVYSNTVGSSAASANPPMRVRVQIQGKTFLIPCPESSGEERKTIAWLAEQAQLRYFTAYGLRPVLVLQTSEGAYLSPEDTIADVLSNNEQVVASLESWDLPPLSERYKTACLSNNSKVRKMILASLQADPQISVLSLRNAAISPTDVLPLARALQCHDRLVKLILPGNKIGDSGLQHIASCLDTLPNLAVLDLRCNGLTHKGLKHLVNSIKKSADQQQISSSTKLEELSLSCNDLTDTCGTLLADILVTCPYLNSIQLQSVWLTGRAFEPGKPLSEAIKVSRLRHFEVSHNPIGGKGIRDLLLAIPSNIMTSLDLSSTGLNKSTVGIVTEALLNYMNKEDCVLQSLIMSDCCLSCCDVVRLAETLCFKSSLRSLDVSCNVLETETNNTLARSLSNCRSQISFNLRGNRGIGGTFLEELLTNLATSRSSPLSFNLSSCGVSSPLPENIFHALKHSAIPLFGLDLSFCELSHEEVSRISDAWRQSGDGRLAAINGPLCELSTTL